MTLPSMNEEEFKQAIRTAIKETFDDMWGPIDLDRLYRLTSIKFTSPQEYRGADVSTHDKLLEHIGNMYANGAQAKWSPNMGVRTRYPDYVACNNFPQQINHICGTMVFNTAKEMTIRNMGWLVFAINGLPRWLDGLLVFLRKKYKKIMADTPKPVSEDEFAKMLCWNEPNALLASALGPTDPSLIELWRMAAKTRYSQHNAGITAQLFVIKRRLAILGNETIAFLEQIPCVPKYGTATNCADVPIIATM